MRNIVIFLALLVSACNMAADSTPATDIVEYNAAQIALPMLLQQKVAAKKTPVLYFYADWCGPCRRFRSTLDTPELEAALNTATLIKINIDVDTLLMAQYGIEAVPTFVKVDHAGNKLAQITGDEWANDVPEDIAPVMQKLTQSTEYDTK